MCPNTVTNVETQALVAGKAMGCGCTWLTSSIVTPAWTFGRLYVRPDSSARMTS